MKQNQGIKQYVVQNRLSQQRGASLLEGIAYLGIAAIVVLGAVSLLTGAFSSASSNQGAEEITALRTAVRKLYVGQAYGNGTNLLPVLIPARAIPNTLVVDAAAGTMTNKWGGAVTVAGNAAAAGASPAGTTFVITYNNVPRDVCVSMVSGASGWQFINATQLNEAPATAAQAGAICNAANNNVAFVAT